MPPIPNKNNVVVDFESYYDTSAGGLSAKTQGVKNYVRESYAYLASVVDTNGDKWVGSIEELQKRYPYEYWMDGDNVFWAANSNFDQCWVEQIYGKPVKPWRCLLDLGANHQHPQHLAGLVKNLFGRKMDKSVRDFMDGKHWKDLSEEDKTRVTNYCLDDSVEEMEVLEALPQMSSFEDSVAMLTRWQNRTGVYVDHERVEKDRTSLLEYRHRCFTRIPWVEAGDKPLSPIALRKWCEVRGIPQPKSVAQDSIECDEIMAAYPEFNELMQNIRGFRKANTMAEKIDAVFRRTTEEGVMPLEMMYCGARHTRRWSSRGVNVQNLNREPFILNPVEGWGPYDIMNAVLSGKDIPQELVYVYPRFWIVPPPGKTFLILDYSQIEPRCLNWLAGNDELLDLIRSGFSVYEAYARSVGVWKGNESLNVGNPELYKSIKAEVLGLGYGMGAPRYAKENNMTLEESKLAVARFRQKNPKVPALWRSMDETIRQAVADRSHRIEIEMPNGEWLRHFNVQVRTFKDPVTHKIRSRYETFTIQNERSNESIISNLYGAALTENVTQRMARDIMALGLVNLAKAGFHVVFSSHDEAVIAVDDDATKADARKHAEEILATPPAWADNLPLQVSGGFANRYTKL